MSFSKPITKLKKETIRRKVRRHLDIGCKPLCFSSAGHMHRIEKYPAWCEDYAWQVWDRWGNSASGR